MNTRPQGFGTKSAKEVQEYLMWEQKNDIQNDRTQNSFSWSKDLNIVTCICISAIVAGFGLIIGFIEHLYTQLVTTSNFSAIANPHSAIQYSTNVSLLSLLYPHQSSGNGYQRRTLLFLWVLELSPCLSYQFLTATAHKD
jgi:hypothetical protein